MKKLSLALLLILSCFSLQAQEISETNTDILLKVALEKYKAGEYKETLLRTQHGLSLAPEYHDIRLLQIRALWALNSMQAADQDLDYLLEHASTYPGVKPLVLQRLNHFQTPSEALVFLGELDQSFGDDLDLQLRKAQFFLKAEQPKQARNLASELISSPGISGEQRYSLQLILNRTVFHEIGLTYHNISFSEDYSRNAAWNNLAAEYQHNFNRTAVIGRINYSDRATNEGFLYELEAYPVFSDRLYAYTNLGFSDGTLFPNFRTNLSLYYNFAKIFEGEIGGRGIFLDDTSYFTGILGLSIYQGKFLFNARTFFGPERRGKYVQNYQGNIRYYLNTSDNYLFIRVGSGISPDERFRETQVQEHPSLKAYYSNLGVRHLFWNRHILQLEAGLLFEDITQNRSGNQISLGVGYRYRF